MQTFVLAQQPTGYFVLNDIFRYINEEGEEEQVEAAQEESATPGPLVEDVEMPKAQAAAEEPATAPLDAEVVDQKLEEVVEPEVVEEAAPATNGTSAPETQEPSVPEPEAEPEVEEVATPEAAAKEVEEEIKEPEKPKDPVSSPAPVKTEAPAKPAAPAQPTGPPKPMSWANRAAAAAGTAPRPAVPIVTPKAVATPPAQPRAVSAAQAPKPAAAPAPTPAPTPSPVVEKDKENVGWQSVGDSAKRQNRPQSISSPPEKEGTMGYVRNVTDKVSVDELREALGKHGNMIYFDVNRTKVGVPRSILNSSLTHTELRLCRILQPCRIPQGCCCQPSPGFRRVNLC